MEASWEKKTDTRAEVTRFDFFFLRCENFFSDRSTKCLAGSSELLCSFRLTKVSDMSFLQLILTPDHSAVRGWVELGCCHVLEFPVTGKYTPPSKHMSHTVCMWLMGGQPGLGSMFQFIFMGLMMSCCGVFGVMAPQTCCCTQATIAATVLAPYGNTWGRRFVSFFVDNNPIPQGSSSRSQTREGWMEWWRRCHSNGSLELHACNDPVWGTLMWFSHRVWGKLYVRPAQ